MNANFAKGLFFGSITVGLVTALSTPKKGKDLRKDIKDEAQLLYNESCKGSKKQYK